MENLRKVKGNSGITLVALVVTIIVLLILAGITIAMLTGENGIINRAFQAKEATEYAQIEEEVALAWTEVQAEKVIENLSQEETADYLEEVLKQNDPNASVEYRDENDTYEVDYKDHMFEIQPNGELTHNREDAIKDIEEAWNNADKNGTEEDIASDMEDELQGKDPDSTSEYNPDTGKIDVDHGGYEVEVDPDTGEITIKDPIKVEKAEVNITGEPQDVEVFAGNTATFIVEAEATGEVTYQWYKNTSASTISGQAIPGANSSSYTTPATTTADNGTYYYCEITSSLNGKTVKDKTVGAKLTVTTKVEIGEITTPEITVEEGDTANIEVPVTGGEGSDVKYQWYKNDKDSNEGGEPIGDATSNPLEIPDVSKDDDGYYYVEITQTVGDDEVVIKSDPIKVTVTEKVEPVQISAQPESAEALEGESANFSVEVTGDGDITYQWYKSENGSTTNGTPIDGANKATYEIEEVSVEDDGTYYYCEVTQTTPTKENKVTTNPAKLTVISKVEIEVQPSSTEAIEGQTATFEVEVTGEGNITYQWYKNGEKIPGANNSSYTTEALTPENSGDKYYCEITQEHNGQQVTITTQEAMLTVLNVNISANPLSVQLYEGGKDVTVEITGTNYGDLTLSGINEEIATAKISGETITISPVAAGSTTLTITESNANKTAEVQITVSSTSIIPDVEEVNLTYGGEAQTITLDGVNVEGFEVVTGPDTNVATGSIDGNELTITPIGAGETSITIRETNGGKEITIPITIEKATPNISLDNTEGNTDYNTTNSFKVTPNSTPEVDGTLKVTSSDPSKVTIISGDGENASNGQESTIEYKGTGATESPVTITVTFTPEDTQNYEEVSITYTVTVNKVPAINPVLTAYTGTYDGMPHTIGVSGGEGGTIVYSTDQSIWSEELPTRTEQGTTTVYVKVQGDSNHTDSEVISSTITIGEDTITYQSGDYKGKYDGAPHGITLNVTNPASGITIYYSDTEELNEGNYSAASTTPIQRTDAGETIIYWYIHSESSNYQDVAGSNKITIERATTVEGGEGEEVPAVTAKPIQTPEGGNLSYNGQEQTGVTGTNVEFSGDIKATNAGTYTAYATPTANYAWSDGTTDAREVKWTLAPKDVQVQWEETSLIYNRVAQKPTASVETGLVLETISLNISTNKEAINVGSYTATAEIESVTGGQALASNYNLTNSTTPFEIVAKDSTTNPGDPEDPNTGVKATVTQPSVVYNGEEQEPSVKVTDDGVDLIQDTDYTVDYSNNINAGTAQAIITLQGNYSGTITVNFEITKMPIMVPQGQSLTYNGQTQTGVTQGEGYTLSGTTQAQTVGNYTATASLIDTNNTMWEDSTTEPKEISWSIAAKTPSTTNPDEVGANITVTLDNDTYTYDGTAKTPTPTVRDTDLSTDLLQDTDYTVDYSNNTNAGEGQVIINLKGNYGGQVIKTFTINKKQITVPEANTNLVYNGSEQVGVPQGDGYTVETGTATEVNTYTARVSLTDTANTEWNDSTTDPKTIQWEIKAKPAVGEDGTNNITVTLSQTSYTYDGQEKTPEPTVKDVATGATLQKDKDYDVQYQDNRDEGTGKVIVTLKGNYSGEITAEFTIEAGGMEIVANDYSGPYDGQAHSITVTVTTPSTGTTIYYSETELNEGNYSAASTAPITKTEAGEYTIYWYVHSSDTNYKDKSGSNKINIARATQGPDGQPLVTFNKVDGTETTPLTYNGTEQTGVTGQNVTITGDSTGINAGEYTAYAEPTANYAWQDGTTDKREITWSISAKEVAVVWGEESFTYNGSEQGPSATVDSGVIGETIVLNTTKETNAGNHTSTASIAEVTGGQARAENYILTNTTKQYQIAKQGIEVPQAVTGLVYNGQEQTGVPEGEGYTITGNKATSAGNYTAIATLTDNTNTQWSDGTSGEKQIPWSIAAKTSSTTNPDDPSSEFTVTLSENTYTYDGTQKQPTVTVQDKTAGTQLQENIDYTKQYNNNTNAGTANVTITLKGNYSGTLVKEFTINKKDIQVPTAIEGLVYNGQVQTGVANGEGYSLTGNTGTEAKQYTATATLTDTANTQWPDTTTEPKQISWSIAVKQIPEGEENQDIQVTLSENNYTYDGTEKRPNVTVKDTVINKTLEQDADYTLQYRNNTNAGEAQVVVTLKGNYQGTVTTTFTIAKKQITVPTATPNIVYNGSEQTGVAQGDGYTVQNGTATNQGNYTATVSLIDTANTEWQDGTTDPKEIEWQIGAKQINEEDPSQELNIQLSQNTYTYDGTEKRPDVTITDLATSTQLQKDIDYTLGYDNNTNAGEAQVIITLQGNYAGTLTIEFTIQISGMEITANDYKGTYDGQPHTITLEVTNPSTGAQIYYSTTEELNESNYNTAGSLDKPTATDASETTVYWYIVSNSTNFENQAGSNKITITQATGSAQVTITGTNKIGETLTAQVNTASDGAKTYQWWYADSSAATSGTAIPDANTETYQLDGTYAGKYIGVTVSVAESNNYTSCTASDITDTDTNGTALAWQIPTIEITPVNMQTVVGNSVIYTATPNGTYDNVTYQWYINTENTAGAGTTLGTNATYTYTPETAGTYYISVVATYTYSTLTQPVTSTTATIEVQDKNYSITKNGEVTYYGTLATANADATEGDTITVLKDVTDSSTANIDKTINLDTQSYTITTDKTISVIEGGTLTLAGQGQIQSSSVNGITNTGTITIGNSEDALSITAPSVMGETYGINNIGTFNFYNGIVKGQTGGYDVEPEEVRRGYYAEKGTEKIENTTYQTAYLKKDTSELAQAIESGQEFTEQKTISDREGDTITIPKGYRVTEDSEYLVNDGVVISDAKDNGNEWVWVPVKDPSIMYEENTAGVALSGSTGVSTTRYSASGIMSGYSRGLPGSSTYREPDLVTNYDNDSNAQQAGFSSLSNMASTMVSEYSTMIDSVSKYGGFYIGRYELTADGTKPGTVLTNTNWYTLYKNCTTLAKSGSNTMSRMIWGAQWDVTCLWLQENDYDINDSRTWGNYNNTDVYSSDGTEIIKPNGTSQKLETGITTFTRANNVYDLAGNCFEWTQEANYTNYRVFRGGVYDNNGSNGPVTDRSGNRPTISNFSDFASRPTLILMPPYHATVGEESTEQGTINGEEGTYQNPTVPKGYYPINTDTAVWDGADGPQWNNGLVISDSASNGNEWVWVPVKDPSIMYEENSAGVALSGSTGVKATKYSKSGIISGKSRGLPGSTSYREPDLVTRYDNDSRAQSAGFSSLQNMAQTMVNEYNTMIASIEKYGGFYIGRYELTANGVKPGTVLTNTSWYNLYKNCTTLAKSGSNTMSRMIWGAQWDVTCLWLEQNDYDISDSTSWGNYSNNTASGHGSKRPTGYSESWKANNVYDFAGNCREWTQEAYNTNFRVDRGGYYSSFGSSNPATTRDSVYPTLSSNSNYTSRPTLILMPPYQATVGEESTEQGTINGEEGSYQNPTIPKGYIPINTDTAVWDGADGPQWNNGLVISDSASNGNEWVWVPVKDPSIMYEENPAGVALSGGTGVKTTKYSKDLLPDDGETIGTPGSSSYREPDLVVGSGGTSYDYSNYGTAGFSSLENMASTMVSEYSTMIDSVSKYGGFYIGRYELTANGTKPGTVLTNTNWYTLYKNCTTLSKSGSNTMSRMIWGAQWDVTCLWLEQGGYDINNSESYGNYYGTDVYSSDGEEIIKPRGRQQKLETGITTFTRANNVYDLAGNCIEWTQEANGTIDRVGRGGYYNNLGSSYPVTFRYTYTPPSSDSSSRRISSHFNIEPMTPNSDTL